MSALVFSSLSLTACTGTVEGPFGPSPSKSTGDRGDLPTGDSDSAQRDEATDKPAAVGDPSTPDGVGWATRFPKLSNRQWENTVKALFYLDAPTGLSKDFTQEPLDKAYEPMAAAELTIGGDAWARYQTAAETLAAQIVADDAKLAKIAPAGGATDVTARGNAFIDAFGQRAYRRPLTSLEQSAYRALFKLGPELVGGDAFKAGARVVIEGMLQSPFFLYRVELSDAKSGADRKVQLSGYEVAARLSYALWNSMPSDALLAAAKKGELDTKEGVVRWAETLLDDPRANEVLLAFHEQTFQVGSYGTQDKDPVLGFDADALAPVLREEAHRFFELVVIEQAGGIAQLLTEPTAFVNEDTAKLYGITGITGKTLQKAALDATQRAGLLSQLGFLTKNATRSTSDPVHRGLVVVRKVLCDEPDPPPMMFDLPSPMAGLTTRQVYERATSCGVGCHDNLINPPGFAFETFDALGRFRTNEAGKPIDATGTLSLRVGYTSAEKLKNPASEISFDGPVELVTQLAEEPRVHECYARNWLQYVLARELDPAERGAWEALAEQSKTRGSARALLLALVSLDTFRTRVSDTL